MSLLFLLLLAIVVIASVYAENQGDCAVCERVLDQIYETLTEADKKDHLLVEQKILDFCKEQVRGEGRRVCYSIETKKRDTAKPMTFDMPSIKICKRLARQDYEICRISEGGGVKKTDLSTIEPEKMRAKALKKILNEYDAKCVGCTDKSEFVAKVKEVIAQNKKEEL